MWLCISVCTPITSQRAIFIFAGSLCLNRIKLIKTFSPCAITLLPSATTQNEVLQRNMWYKSKNKKYNDVCLYGCIEKENNTIKEYQKK